MYRSTVIPRWWNNQFRQLLSGMAYVLFEAMRTHLLKNTRLEKSTPQTLRFMLFLRFNANHAEKEYAELASFFLADCQGSDSEKTAQFINAIEALIQATKIPVTLQELEIKRSDIPCLAEDSMLQTRLLMPDKFTPPLYNQAHYY